MKNIFTISMLNIVEIKNAPRTFERKQVTIKGTATSDLSILSYGLFEVEDRTGTIAVATRNAVPRIGDKVTITGTVRQALSWNDKQLVLLVEDSRVTSGN
ncbi:MAG TPA: hypothetical protein VFC63_12975 [Blastocatellia bacterium]|nr:hypothetical protein [Blastocatellia bacterium]